jgi:isoquinoline 1-oxidoreductase alpha subunit
MKKITLFVNGIRRQVDSDPDRSLLQVLREELDLTGAKYGCGEGQCGACTVLIGARARRSCVTMLSEAEGKQVTTIEGLAAEAPGATPGAGRLHPLQEAFLKAGAMQCGYCTPGMIMAGVAFLQRTSNPSDEEILRSMQGNVCRCGTYPRIVGAIREAGMVLRKDGKK